METKMVDPERQLTEEQAAEARAPEAVHAKADRDDAEEPGVALDDMSPLERAVWRLRKPALMRWHAMAQTWAARNHKTE